MEGMAGSTTQTTHATQIPQVDPVDGTTTDNVVLLVRLAMSIKEMGCEP